MNLKQFVIEWNLKNPLDRWWREKHKIAFNSKQHREITPVDIVFEFVEDKLYNKSVERETMNKKKLEDFEKGKWIKEQEINKEQENQLLDKLVDSFKLS